MTDRPIDASTAPRRTLRSPFSSPRQQAEGLDCARGIRDVLSDESIGNHRYFSYAPCMVSTELRATLFHGFADPNRLRIIEALRDGERRVTDVVAETALPQSTVSTHLACLWECGLVARERRGREMYYRLTAGVAKVLAAADRVLAQAGETVGACPRYGSGREAA